MTLVFRKGFAELSIRSETHDIPHGRLFRSGGCLALIDQTLSDRRS